MNRAKIPATLKDDETLIRTIAERYGAHRWMFVPNTLHLDRLFVTPDLVAELQGNSVCTLSDVPAKVEFHGGRQQLFAGPGDGH